MHARFAISALVLGLLLAACGKGDEEKSDCPDDGEKTPAGEQFASRYAVAYCDLRNDCYPVAFEDEFGSIDSCQKAVSKREIQRECDGCSLDGDQADTCVNAAETITCEDWVDDDALTAACDGRWDCSDPE